MSLSFIHFGEVIFGGVEGIIDFLRRHGLLARTADCGRYSASKCTVISVFYTESCVKIRSTERPVKNTEVVGNEC